MAFKSFSPAEVEKKWQTAWATHEVFKAQENSDKPHVYILEMFPYPSGTLHMGHARNYVLGDMRARYYWAQGYNVNHPMGWDACGLPAENAALKHAVHPKDWTYRNAAIMKNQCQSLGFSHDWSREIFSCDPSYYKHEQKIFLEFYARGLAYRKESYVNWDPVEHSVLANEQVINGRGWRSGAVVEKKLLEQWFLRITNFADELILGLEELKDWPESVRQMQLNWIGRSEGVRVTFPLATDDGVIEIFTTRPETLFGATFCAISPDHPLARQWALECPEVKAFIDDYQHRSTALREPDPTEKWGIFSGHYVHHPLLPEKRIPVYIATYVLMGYGTGAIFGCPGHDQRDFDFAKDYGLPIITVIRPFTEEIPSEEVAYTEDGLMIQSEFLNGMTTEAARQEIIQMLTEKNMGQKEIIYRLNDWGIGRQRYWGVPIPIIHCPSCGIVPVPEADLPVCLPEDVTFDQPGNPLERHPTWKHVTCPTCQGQAQRETDTFDTFMESSWYFARFCDPFNPTCAFDEEKTLKWMPVDEYIGGIEHAVLHLLYARFFTRALKACGYWRINEPFKALFTQGMVCHKSYKSPEGEWLYPEEVRVQGSNAVRISDGASVTVGRCEKMSKSKNNVVSVTRMVETYGADAVRLSLLSDTPPEKDLEWTDGGIEGAWRYVNRLWNVYQEKVPLACSKGTEQPEDFSEAATTLRKKVHTALFRSEDSLQKYHFNKYVAHLREGLHPIAEFIPSTPDEQWALREALEIFAQLWAPALPHLAEELWEVLGYAPFIHQAPWPVGNVQLLTEDIITMAVQIDGKMRGTISVPVGAPEEILLEHVRAQEKIAKFLDQKTLVKVIIIPDKVISILTQHA